VEDAVIEKADVEGMNGVLHISTIIQNIDLFSKSKSYLVLISKLKLQFSQLPKLSSLQVNPPVTFYGRAEIIRMHSTISLLDLDKG